MTTAIQEYSKTDAALAELAQRYQNVVFDVTTRDGMSVAVKGRAELRTYRVELEKTRVEIKAPALERCRLIDAEAKRITAALVALEEPIDATIKKEESRKEAERLAKIEAEERRVAALHERIAELRGNQSVSALTGSVVLSEHISDLVAIPVDDSFQEFRQEAEAAKAAGLARLREIHASAIAHEADQRQLRADREELERMRKEEELRVKQAAERDAAAIRQRAIDAAAQQAEFDRVERDARLKREADDRKAQEARDEADRVARLAREAEQRRLQEEADRLAAERRAIEDTQRAQREAQEAAERDAREEAERARLAQAIVASEARRKADELLGACDMLVTFRNRYADLAEFAKVHKAIDAYMTDYNTKQRKAA